MAKRTLPQRVRAAAREAEAVPGVERWPGWSPAVYMICGHATADRKPLYRAARADLRGSFPVTVCIGFALWKKPGQAFLDAEEIMAGRPTLAAPRRMQ